MNQDIKFFWMVLGLSAVLFGKTFTLSRLLVNKYICKKDYWKSKIKLDIYTKYYRPGINSGQLPRVGFKLLMLKMPIEHLFCIFALEFAVNIVSSIEAQRKEWSDLKRQTDKARDFLGLRQRSTESCVLHHADDNAPR